MITAHEKQELIKIHYDDASRMTFDEILRECWNTSKVIRVNKTYENSEVERDLIEKLFINIDAFNDVLEERVKAMKAENDAAEAMAMNK